MNVMIGIDPHKASHTAIAIGRDEDEVASVKVRATSRQVDELLCWADARREAHLGHRVSRRDGLPAGAAAGGPRRRRPRCASHVASHVRVLATGRSNKNDPNEAHSIAIAALRAPMLRQVEPADHGEVLRLLSKRNWDLGRQRARWSAGCTRSSLRSLQAKVPRKCTYLTPRLCSPE